MTTVIAVADSPFPSLDPVKAALKGLDADLRLFFESLEREGRLDDSLVIVTADHGEELLDHGGGGHGHTLFEELVQRRRTAVR